VIISFAWTTPALVDGRKTVTRRDWNPGYLRRWQQAWDRGDYVHQAWNASPRAGGRQVGWITLTHRPYLERLADMPAADLDAEGGDWKTLGEFIGDRDPATRLAVIRFSFEPLQSPQLQLGFG